MTTPRNPRSRLAALLAAAVVLVGGTLLPATAHAATTASSQASSQRSGDCTTGAIADLVDPRPGNVYGAGWVRCAHDWPALGVFVELYRDGDLVSSGHNSCGGSACGANTPEYTDSRPGKQAWRAHVIVRSDGCTCDSWSSVFYH